MYRYIYLLVILIVSVIQPAENITQELEEPQNKKINAITVSLNNNMIDSVPKLIDDKYITGINRNNLYLSDVTAQTTGVCKSQIIFVGEQGIEDELPKISYVLKRVEVEPSNNFINSEISCFLMDYERINVFEVNEYKLRFIWPEKIFQDQDNKNVYYELMNAAQGKILSTEFELSRKSVGNKFNGLIFETKNNLPELVDINWKEINAAYKAVGAVFGAYFRKLNLSYDVYAFDPHHDNLFFDDKNNTVTWIDLHRLGEYFAYKKVVRPSCSAMQRLINSYKTKGWGNIFAKEKHFYHGVLSFYPEAEEPTVNHLKKIRDDLFCNIRGVIETFINAFVEYYDPKKEEIIKKYVRTLSYFPFNKNPKWSSPSKENFGQEFIIDESSKECEV